MVDRVFNVLFLCTGNTGRSILAERFCAKMGRVVFAPSPRAATPNGEFNPFALRVLESLDYPTDGLRSKGWEEFAAPGAPEMISCSPSATTRRARACPVWPGQPMTAHWGIEDPAAVEGTDIQKEAAFVTAARYIKNRISAFTSLPIKSLDRLSIAAKVREIGKIHGATKPRPEGA